MTEEQKEILIAKMLDAPSSLSDVELDSILHDDELRDIYEASAALSSACIRQPEWDMKAEWNSFRPRIHNALGHACGCHFLGSAFRIKSRSQNN